MTKDEIILKIDEIVGRFSTRAAEILTDISDTEGTDKAADGLAEFLMVLSRFEKAMLEIPVEDLSEKDLVDIMAYYDKKVAEFRNRIRLIEHYNSN